MVFEQPQSGTLKSHHPTPHACIQSKILCLFKGFAQFQKAAQCCTDKPCCRGSGARERAGTGEKGWLHKTSITNAACLAGLLVQKKELRGALRAIGHRSCLTFEFYIWIYWSCKCPHHCESHKTHIIQSNNQVETSIFVIWQAGGRRLFPMAENQQLKITWS